MQPEERRLLKLFWLDGKNRQGGLADLAVVEVRYGAGFRQAFDRLLYLGHIMYGGDASRIRVTASGADEARKP